MEHSKWILVQVLMVGVALAQQHPDPYQLAQQIGARSTPFQQQQQQRNAPNFFQQQQQQQQQQQVAPSFAQQRPVTAFRTAPQAQSAFGRSQASGSTQTFGGGSETFMQITTRDQGASQQTRTVPAASQPAPQQNFFQQQRVAPPAPRPAPAQFPAPALTPTAFPAPAPAPVVLPNAVAAPVQQHDAQVFTRRPPPPPAPVTKQAQQFRQAPRPSQEFNANRLPAVVQDGTGFQPQPNEVQSFLPQQDPQAFQDGEDVFQQEVQRAPQVQQAPARQVTRNPEVRTRGPARHAAQLVDDSAPLRANPIRVAPAPVQVTTDDQGNPQEDDQLFREQAQNAHYTFASAVDDKLTDNSQVRQETRDGTNLKGLYSYSDGYFRRTVHYEADENGYRVTKEEVEPIGDGPVPDPTGSADVAAQFSGADYRYRITADDIRERKEERQASAQPVFSS